VDDVRRGPPDLAVLADHVRRWQRAAVYWVAVAALAAATVWLVSHQLGRADSTVRAWGERVRTVVMTVDAPAGHRLAAADMRLVDLPAAARPADALDEAPVGAPLAAAVYAGEPLVAGRVAPSGVSALAASLPAGHRGMAVPVDVTMPPLEPGDVVELRAATIDDAGALRTEPAGTARVIAVEEESVVVAVPVASVDGLVAALAGGPVVAVLVPPADQR
jgi:Flp pilus assembly protein CpaB